jgi:DNA repair protein RadC
MNTNATQLALTLEPADLRRSEFSAHDRSLIAAAIACLEARYQVPRAVLTSPEATRDYVKLRLDGLGYEIFAMILLNNRHGVLRYLEPFRGTLDGASVHPREVVRSIIAHNATAEGGLI